ncbi:MAG: PHP domain-containing protein, partial [Candidatus Methylomirabilales bacterium]
MVSVDLHCHTTASDGTLPPCQLVQEAKRDSIALLSVTDHDTTAGLGEALEEGRRLGLMVIPGVEVTGYVEDLEVHI